MASTNGFQANGSGRSAKVNDAPKYGFAGVLQHMQLTQSSTHPDKSCAVEAPSALDYGNHSPC